MPLWTHDISIEVFCCCQFAAQLPCGAAATKHFRYSAIPMEQAARKTITQTALANQYTRSQPWSSICWSARFGGALQNNYMHTTHVYTGKFCPAIIPMHGNLMWARGAHASTLARLLACSRPAIGSLSITVRETVSDGQTPTSFDWNVEQCGCADSQFVCMPRMCVCVCGERLPYFERFSWISPSSELDWRVNAFALPIRMDWLETISNGDNDRWCQWQIGSELNASFQVGR